jgi:antitoxin component YwqK of YwqJK toxin-antitoxin module
MQSCKAQENNIKKDTMIYPIVTKDFETFDENHYIQLKQKDEFNTTEFLPNGNYFEMGTFNKDGRQAIEHYNNSYFNVNKFYYKNNKIKLKGVIVNNGTALIGTWYEFDEKGNLIKEIDYDKNYKFTFEDILKFCERENIRVDKGPILQSTGFHTYIFREYLATTNESTWTIEWLKSPDIIQTINLDGTIGKVLSRKDTHYENN